MNNDSYVTHSELNELMQGILTGIDDMFKAQNKRIDETLERHENKIMMRIENGIGKQVQANGEAISGIFELLDRVESVLDEVKQAVTRHDDELYIIKKAK